MKPGQEFHAEAHPPDMGALAVATGLTESLLVEIGETALYIRGKLVDTRPWKKGPAKGDGVAQEGDTQIPVNAKPKFQTGEESLSAVKREYEAIHRRTDPALDRLPKGLSDRFHANADRSRLYATKLVSP